MYTVGTECGLKSTICVALLQHNEVHQNQFEQEKLRPKPLAVLCCPDSSNIKDPIVMKPSQAIPNEL